MDQAKRKEAVLAGVASACRQQQLPVAVTDEILVGVGSILEAHDLGDPVASREKMMEGVLREQYPELFADHEAGMLSFIARLGKQPPERWDRLYISASWMFGTYINYRDAEGRIDVARIEVLIDLMEQADLLYVDYHFVEEDEDGDEDSIDIEKDDIPPPGVIGINPMTGEPDPDFHDKIERHFRIGRMLTFLFEK